MNDHSHTPVSGAAATDTFTMNTEKSERAAGKAATSPRTLVIPDIHMRCAMVDEILATLASRYDQIVLLGDYFDRPPTERGSPVSPGEAESVVTWLKDSLARKNRVHLVGNHDLSYFVPRKETYCSGTTTEIRRSIQDGLLPHLLWEFRAATQVGPWLLSHAGFHVSHVIGRDATTLVAAANADLELLLTDNARFPVLLGCGWARCGDFRYGGVTWCDWDIEFRPVRGLHQVVGHTYEQCTVRGCYLRRRGRKVFMESIEPKPGETVVRTIGDNDSCNWCIDTGLEVVAILEGETIRFVRWRTA